MKKIFLAMFAACAMIAMSSCSKEETAPALSKYFITLDEASEDAKLIIEAASEDANYVLALPECAESDAIEAFDYFCDGMEDALAPLASLGTNVKSTFSLRAKSYDGKQVKTRTVCAE